MMQETLLSGTARKAEIPGWKRPARPAPARISATPGSSATPPTSSPASGSAMTTTRRPGRRPAAACRWKSGPLHARGPSGRRGRGLAEFAARPASCSNMVQAASQAARRLAVARRRAAPTAVGRRLSAGADANSAPPNPKRGRKQPRTGRLADGSAVRSGNRSATDSIPDDPFSSEANAGTYAQAALATSALAIGHAACA